MMMMIVTTAAILCRPATPDRSACSTIGRRWRARGEPHVRMCVTALVETLTVVSVQACRHTIVWCHSQDMHRDCSLRVCVCVPCVSDHRRGSAARTSLAAHASAGARICVYVVKRSVARWPGHFAKGRLDNRKSKSTEKTKRLTREKALTKDAHHAPPFPPSWGHPHIQPLLMIS